MAIGIGINLLTSLETVDHYAEITHQKIATVRTQIHRGILPVVYLSNGKRAKPYVNMLALHAMAAKAANLKVSYYAPSNAPSLSV